MIENRTSEPPDHGYLQSDEPILRRSEDRLNRAGLAEAIAEQVIHSPAGQGFVIAVDGPWGSGKTSVLNMIEETVAERSETVILRFNPWLFSGTEQLVVRFLQELSVQLGERAEEVHDERLRDIGDRLARYGEVLVPLGWVPVVGPWLARVGGLAKVVGRSRKEKPPSSVLSQQQAVKAALAELDRRVLVIVDDLDRVEAEQTRDVVRLVKLVGDFPNVTYLLAYDSGKIAEALGADVDEGRAYLEKIVQVTHALPETDDWPLVRLLQTELQAALDVIDHGPFDHDEWVNIFHTSMRPFFRNVRDVRRYLNAVPVTLRVLGREVALVDALALETLRVFAPGAYAKLASLVSILTGEGRGMWGTRSRERDEAEGRAIVELVEAAAPHQTATREMLRRLFPRIGGHVGGSTIHGGEQEYRRKRQVADPGVLRIYLRRTLPEGTTPAQLVQEAFEVMGDRERFTELLNGLDAERLEDVLGRLLDYQHEYDPAAAEIATEVLINQIPRLREHVRGMMDFGAGIAVTRVVLRVLERVEDENKRTEIVKRVLPRIEQLSGREELLDVVGHRENAGHKLIPKEEADELYRQQNEYVLAADPSVLARERGLASLFYRASEHGGGAERNRVRELCQHDDVFLGLLRSALSEHQSQTVGDLAIRSTPALWWPGLIDMVGDEDMLKRRISEVAGRIDRDQLDDRTRLALETAERYSSGELPPRERF